MRVDRNFVLEKINSYINIAKYSAENIYDKNYRVIYNNFIFKKEHTKIFIENDLIKNCNIEITKKSVSFSKDYFYINVGILSDLVEEEKIYFQIDLDIEIKILVSLEQYNKIYNKYIRKFIMSLEKIKEPKFLNIIYPFLDNNMQKDMFLFKNLEQKLIDNNLFYELSFYTIKNDKINNLSYFYKKVLDKHFFIPREKVLECYEYRNDVLI